MKYATDYGYEIKPVYGPSDIEGVDYERDLGDPGSFPYTRGYYQNGYRSRMWTRRMTAGLGSSKDANKVLKKYREMGQRGGMCVIHDRVSCSCIDADHPLALRENGVLGWPGSSLLEFEELMEDIPLTGQSVTLLGCCAPSSLRLAYVVALAEKRGIDPSEIHGSVFESPFGNVFGQTDVHPFDINMKLFLDVSEYVVRNKIKMRGGLVGQHFQESGGNNAQMLAIELSMLKEVCGRLVNERGLEFEQAMRVPYQLVSIGSRFFEEVAKVRALRRMWAKMAKEHFGAKDEKSCQLLIAVHTSGRVMTYQQPLNNIARSAIQTLAGAMVGCTALDNATLDNAHAEPSALAALMSLNTQHIVAEETGVADVVDPLAGSYFVESLTNEVEAAGYRVLEEIDAQGGLVAAIEKGHVQAMMQEESNLKFRQLNDKERLVVGVNHLAIPEEEEAFEIPVQEVEASDSEAIAKRMAEWKKTRDTTAIQAGLKRLYADAKKEDSFNLMPAIIEAVKVYATAGEVMGTIRLARGLSYDHFDMIECPYELG
ncbi:MAG: methylmalonyl-CoA mutase family protein [Alphaproteobacteria bacterium]|jgi:methylmalonyl-CoA mutase N-terminal domain/subunit|nr:methylmalonyl-CoA mutase family protein [Alphaproteobacteria bacterium]MDP6624059.1 methylmalonyl-CoA mutase family protein [Alphaproteobacteria bacterium]|tara:strand:+ start:804 stop:2426 length:1623 start_codon:yes stop_codon:yes gene_type:complete